jgi:hypothetical protein
LLQITQLAPELRIGKMRSKLIGFFQSAPDLLIDQILVLIILDERAVDLSL